MENRIQVKLFSVYISLLLDPRQVAGTGDRAKIRYISMLARRRQFPTPIEALFLATLMVQNYIAVYVLNLFPRQDCHLTNHRSTTNHSHEKDGQQNYSFKPANTSSSPLWSLFKNELVTACIEDSKS